MPEGLGISPVDLLYIYALFLISEYKHSTIFLRIQQAPSEMDATTIILRSVKADTTYDINKS